MQCEYIHMPAHKNKGKIRFLLIIAALLTFTTQDPLNSVQERQLWSARSTILPDRSAEETTTQTNKH